MKNEFTSILDLPAGVVVSRMGISFSLRGIMNDRRVYIGGEEVVLIESLNIANHSPDGFNWGYGGSGPAQLALAVLLRILPKDDAMTKYQQFKREVISILPRSDFLVRIHYDWSDHSDFLYVDSDYLLNLKWMYEGDGDISFRTHYLLAKDKKRSYRIDCKKKREAKRLQKLLNREGLMPKNIIGMRGMSFYISTELCNFEIDINN